MFGIKKVGADLVPVIICDECKKPIEKLKDGIVAIPNKDTIVLNKCLHLHRGTCVPNKSKAILWTPLKKYIAMLEELLK